MLSRTSTGIGLLVFCTFLYIGGVESAKFNLEEGKKDLKKLLGYLLETVLAKGATNFASIDSATDLATLCTVAETYLQRSEVTTLQKYAHDENNEHYSDLRSHLRDYDSGFRGLLSVDTTTQNEMPPLSGDVDLILNHEPNPE